MEEFTFNLLKIEATEDILYVANLILGVDYTVEKTEEGVLYFKIRLESNQAQELYECLKDLDIYIPRPKIYLSDYILMNKAPTKEIMKILKYLNVDNLFAHAISQVKLIRVKRKIYNMPLLKAYKTT